MLAKEKSRSGAILTKKLLCLFLFLHTVLASNAVQAVSDERSFQEIASAINADAWVVMDNRSGEVLVEQNKDVRHYPASITKVATAMMAINQANLDEVAAVSQTAAKTEGSSLELKSGDKLTIRDLLYGIMLHSGNDGAVAIAEHLSGSEEKFAKQMTLFLKTIGAGNTNFVNASGLPDEKHYTTALDMAIITRYAMKNPVFREIVKTKAYGWDKGIWTESLENHESVEAEKLALPWTGKPQIINHNQLLAIYDGAIGIKNGFTHEARYTLVGGAERNGRELIAVILKSDNVDTAYQDMTRLLDYAFALPNNTESKAPQANKLPNVMKPEDNKPDTNIEKQPANMETLEVANSNDDSVAINLPPSSSTGIPFIYLVVGGLFLLAVAYFALALRRR